jgi:DUF1680 family protein
MMIFRLVVAAGCVLLLSLSQQHAHDGGSSEASRGVVVSNRAPLQPNVFNPLPLGAVTPEGWLKRQEQIQAAGLTGHLDEFWSDVGPNSGWLGGTGESWERGPYYLDGLLPLAFQLDDSRLKEKAKRWIEWTLNSQTTEGQFGPAKNDDWWPRMVMLKVLTQYAEVSGDPRVIPFMTKYFRYERTHLTERPLRDWGKYRWQDNAYSVLWLYNRTGDPTLLDLAKLLHEQGYDWERQFENFRYTNKETAQSLHLAPHQPIPEVAMQTHGVNNAMALKAAPVWWLVTGEQSDRTEFDTQINLLDKYHGLPNGMFSADEHFAGPDPSQGIELCAVVESMFSYEQAFAILGDADIADRLERVAYNALPGTLSNDMWSHQYDQQPNQIACTRAHRQWSTNGPDSNLFGLEPNFGCCTANLHQGWPKFVSSLWMATAHGGLVAVAYAPSRVETQIGGTRVSVGEQTAYPFRGDVKLTIHTAAPTQFPLLLRIPKWATLAVVQLNGRVASASDDRSAPTGFFAISREWREGDVVTVNFPIAPRVTHWYHNSVAFEAGPLVFSLPLEGDWTQLKKYAEQSADWEVRPSRTWNYAVELGPCSASLHESALSQTPFDAKAPAVSLDVRGRALPDWSINENSAGPLPISPVTSTKEEQRLMLVPYGAAKVRITAFPYLDRLGTCVATEAKR